MTRVGMEHLWGVSPLTRTLGKGGVRRSAAPPKRVRPQAGCPTFPFYETSKNLSFYVKPPDIQILIIKLKHVNTVPGKRTVVPGESRSCREPKRKKGAGPTPSARAPVPLWAPGARDAVKTLVSPPPASGPNPASSGPRDGDTFPAGRSD